ncbi:cupin domain-containing protein [Methylocystis heyeri]|uniref:Cupin domain-containing protein n=1 Tax=Methylocystis heyeri TaxID=391905 RepID=A0A6B8KBW2_9HYPH|nr:cupin domain-containing protein [Methylocystis heyeri]QGM45676.1 cupin domain-containing protein [Methylocystis heyeri]
MPEQNAAKASKPFALVRGAEVVRGKQGLTFAPGISAESVGSKGLYLELLTIPPGARAKPHLHESHETGIYMISGEATTYYGERLEHKVESRAGDFVYIAPNVPHMPMNSSKTEVAVAVVARTDPNEQESVVLLPELEHLVP